MGNDDRIEHTHVYQCYRCSNLFSRNVTYDRHIKQCSGSPGIVYKFTNQNLIIYEGNFHFRGDLPFAAYFDFETTTSGIKYFLPDNSEMYPVSFVITFTFHPELHIKDCGIWVSQRKEKYAISEMCSTELKLASDSLMKCFNRKYKSQFLETDLLSKNR